MSDASQQQPPSPADLARELIRLREAAYQGPVAAWAMEATMSNDWAGNAMLAGLPRPSIDKSPGFTAGDAAFIAEAFAHARAIAEALLASEAANADMRGKLLTAAERIAAQSELLSKRAAKSEAEARVAELEAALAMCDTMMDSAAMQGVRSILMPSSRDMWANVAITVRAVLAKGEGETP